MVDTTQQEAVAVRKRRFGIAGIAAIAAGVLAVAGWAAFGVTAVALGDSTATAAQAQDDLEHSERDLTGVKLQLRQAENDRDAYKAEVDAIGDREAAVEAKEAELTEREAAVKATEDYQRATTLQDGYSYTVGLTMEAGTYRANSTSDTCYWVIYRSGSNYSDIVDNDLGSMGAITVKVSKGQDFQSSRCGDWKKVG